MVSPRAGETVAELTVAVRNGRTTRDLARTTHPYPTYNDTVWNSAVTDVQARLTRPPMRSALRAGRPVRRAWLDRTAAR